MSEAGGRPRLAAFPKGFFHQLIARRELTIEDFIRRAPRSAWPGWSCIPAFSPVPRRGLSHGCAMSPRKPGRVADDVLVTGLRRPRAGCLGPCCRRHARDGGCHGGADPGGSWRSVRVLSGQAWPGSRSGRTGARAVAGSWPSSPTRNPRACGSCMENHYKDGLWTYPEFARSSSRFLHILNKISLAPVRGELRSVECHRRRARIRSRCLTWSSAGALDGRERSIAASRATASTTLSPIG